MANVRNDRPVAPASIPIPALDGAPPAAPAAQAKPLAPDAPAAPKDDFARDGKTREDKGRFAALAPRSEVSAEDLEAKRSVALARKDPGLTALADANDHGQKLLRAYGVGVPSLSGKEHILARVGVPKEDLEHFMLTGDMSPALEQIFEEAQHPPKKMWGGDQERFVAAQTVAQLIYKVGERNWKQELKAVQSQIGELGSKHLSPEQKSAALAALRQREKDLTGALKAAFETYVPVISANRANLSAWTSAVRSEAEHNEKKATELKARADARGDKPDSRTVALFHAARTQNLALGTQHQASALGHKKGPDRDAAAREAACYFGKAAQAELSINDATDSPKRASELSGVRSAAIVLDLLSDDQSAANKAASADLSRLRADADRQYSAEVGEGGPSKSQRRELAKAKFEARQSVLTDKNVPGSLLEREKRAVEIEQGIERTFWQTHVPGPSTLSTADATDLRTDIRIQDQIAVRDYKAAEALLDKPDDKLSKEEVATKAKLAREATPFMAEVEAREKQIKDEAAARTVRNTQDSDGAPEVSGTTKEEASEARRQADIAVKKAKAAQSGVFSKLSTPEQHEQAIADANAQLKVAEAKLALINGAEIKETTPEQTLALRRALAEAELAAAETTLHRAEHVDAGKTGSTESDERIAKAKKGVAESRKRLSDIKTPDALETARVAQGKRQDAIEEGTLTRLPPQEIDTGESLSRLGAWARTTKTLPPDQQREALKGVHRGLGTLADAAQASRDRKRALREQVTTADAAHLESSGARLKAKEVLVAKGLLFLTDAEKKQVEGLDRALYADQKKNQTRLGAESKMSARLAGVDKDQASYATQMDELADAAQGTVPKAPPAARDRALGDVARMHGRTALAAANAGVLGTNPIDKASQAAALVVDPKAKALAQKQVEVDGWRTTSAMFKGLSHGGPQRVPPELMEKMRTRAGELEATATKSAGAANDDGMARDYAKLDAESKAAFPAQLRTPEGARKLFEGLRESIRLRDAAMKTTISNTAAAVLERQKESTHGLVWFLSEPLAKWSTGSDKDEALGELTSATAREMGEVDQWSAGYEKAVKEHGEAGGIAFLGRFLAATAGDTGQARHQAKGEQPSDALRLHPAMTEIVAGDQFMDPGAAMKQLTRPGLAPSPGQAGGVAQNTLEAKHHFLNKHGDRVLAFQNTAWLVASTLLPMSRAAGVLSIGGNAASSGAIAARVGLAGRLGLQQGTRAFSLATGTGRFIAATGHSVVVMKGQELLFNRVLEPLFGKRSSLNAMRELFGVLQLGPARPAQFKSWKTEKLEQLSKMGGELAIPLFDSTLRGHVLPHLSAEWQIGTEHVLDAVMLSGLHAFHETHAAFGHGQQARAHEAVKALDGHPLAQKELSTQLARMAQANAAAQEHPTQFNASFDASSKALRANIEAFNKAHPDQAIPLPVVETILASQLIGHVMQDAHVKGLSGAALDTFVQEQVRTREGGSVAQMLAQQNLRAIAFEAYQGAAGPALDHLYSTLRGELHGLSKVEALLHLEAVAKQMKLEGPRAEAFVQQVYFLHESDPKEIKFQDQIAKQRDAVAEFMDTASAAVPEGQTRKQYIGAAKHMMLDKLDAAGASKETQAAVAKQIDEMTGESAPDAAAPRPGDAPWPHPTREAHDFAEFKKQMGDKVTDEKELQRLFLISGAAPRDAVFADTRFPAVRNRADLKADYERLPEGAQAHMVYFDMFPMAGANKAGGASGANQLLRDLYGPTFKAYLGAVEAAGGNVRFYRGPAGKLEAIVVFPDHMPKEEQGKVLASAQQQAAAQANELIAHGKLEADGKETPLSKVPNPEDKTYEGGLKFVGSSREVNKKEAFGDAIDTGRQQNKALLPPPPMVKEANEPPKPIDKQTSLQPVAFDHEAEKTPEPSVGSVLGGPVLATVRRRNEFIEGLVRGGVDRQVAERYFDGHWKLDSGVTGCHLASELEPTLEHAAAWVKQTGGTAHYAESDVGNLGGLTKKMEELAGDVTKGRAIADGIFRHITSIYINEVSAVMNLKQYGGEAHFFRKGGDEFGAVLLFPKGTPPEARVAVQLAMLRAQMKVAKFVETATVTPGNETIPIRNIEHLKHLGKPDKAGSGITFGLADLDPSKPIESTLKAADSRVEQKKMAASILIAREKVAKAAGVPDADAPTVARELLALELEEATMPRTAAAEVAKHRAALHEKKIALLKKYGGSDKQILQALYGDMDKKAARNELSSAKRASGLPRAKQPQHGRLLDTEDGKPAPTWEALGRIENPRTALAQAIRDPALQARALLAFDRAMEQVRPEHQSELRTYLRHHFTSVAGMSGEKAAFGAKNLVHVLELFHSLGLNHLNDYRSLAEALRRPDDASPELTQHFFDAVPAELAGVHTTPAVGRAVVQLIESARLLSLKSGETKRLLDPKDLRELVDAVAKAPQALMEPLGKLFNLGGSAPIALMALHTMRARLQGPDGAAVLQMLEVVAALERTGTGRSGERAASKLMFALRDAKSPIDTRALLSQAESFVKEEAAHAKTDAHKRILAKDIATVVAHDREASLLVTEPKHAAKDGEVKVFLALSPELAAAMLPGLHLVDPALLRQQDLDALRSIYDTLPAEQAQSLRDELSKISSPLERVVFARAFTEGWLGLRIGEKREPFANILAKSHDELGRLRSDRNGTLERLHQAPDMIYRASRYNTADPIVGPDPVKSGRHYAGRNEMTLRERSAKLGPAFHATLHRETLELLAKNEPGLSPQERESRSVAFVASVMGVLGAERMTLVPGFTLIVPHGVDRATLESFLPVLRWYAEKARAAGHDFTLERELVLLLPHGVARVSDYLPDSDPTGFGSFYHDHIRGEARVRHTVTPLHSLGGLGEGHVLTHELGGHLIADSLGALRVKNGKSLGEAVRDVLATMPRDASSTEYGKSNDDEALAEWFTAYAGFATKRPLPDAIRVLFDEAFGGPPPKAEEQIPKTAPGRPLPPAIRAANTREFLARTTDLAHANRVAARAFGEAGAEELVAALPEQLRGPAQRLISQALTDLYLLNQNKEHEAKRDRLSFFNTELAAVVPEPHRSRLRLAVAAEVSGPQRIELTRTDQEYDADFAREFAKESVKTLEKMSGEILRDAKGVIAAALLALPRDELGRPLPASDPRMAQWHLHTAAALKEKLTELIADPTKRKQTLDAAMVALQKPELRRRSSDSSRVGGRLALYDAIDAHLPNAKGKDREGVLAIRDAMADASAIRDFTVEILGEVETEIAQRQARWKKERGVVPPDTPEFRQGALLAVLVRRGQAAGFPPKMLPFYGVLSTEEFLRDVVAKGKPFIDQAAIGSDHGALSHFVQMLYLAGRVNPLLASSEGEKTVLGLFAKIAKNFGPHTADRATNPWEQTVDIIGSASNPSFIEAMLRVVVPMKTRLVPPTGAELEAALAPAGPKAKEMAAELLHLAEVVQRDVPEMYDELAKDPKRAPGLRESLGLGRAAQDQARALLESASLTAPQVHAIMEALFPSQIRGHWKEKDRVVNIALALTPTLGRDQALAVAQEVGWIPRYITIGDQVVPHIGPKSVLLRFRTKELDAGSGRQEMIALLTARSVSHEQAQTIADYLIPPGEKAAEREPSPNLAPPIKRSGGNPPKPMQFEDGGPPTVPAPSAQPQRAPPSDPMPATEPAPIADHVLLARTRDWPNQKAAESVRAELGACPEQHRADMNTFIATHEAALGKGDPKTLHELQLFGKAATRFAEAGVAKTFMAEVSASMRDPARRAEYEVRLQILEQPAAVAHAARALLNSAGVEATSSALARASGQARPVERLTALTNIHTAMHGHPRAALISPALISVLEHAVSTPRLGDPLAPPWMSPHDAARVTKTLLAMSPAHLKTVVATMRDAGPEAVILLLKTVAARGDRLADHAAAADGASPADRAMDEIVDYAAWVKTQPASALVGKIDLYAFRSREIPLTDASGAAVGSRLAREGGGMQIYEKSCSAAVAIMAAADADPYVAFIMQRDPSKMAETQRKMMYRQGQSFDRTHNHMSPEYQMAWVMIESQAVAIDTVLDRSSSAEEKAALKTWQYKRHDPDAVKAGSAEERAMRTLMRIYTKLPQAEKQGLGLLGVRDARDFVAALSLRDSHEVSGGTFLHKQLELVQDRTGVQYEFRTAESLGLHTPEGRARLAEASTTYGHVTIGMFDDAGRGHAMMLTGPVEVPNKGPCFILSDPGTEHGTSIFVPVAEIGQRDLRRGVAPGWRLRDVYLPLPPTEPSAVKHDPLFGLDAAPISVSMPRPTRAPTPDEQPFEDALPPTSRAPGSIPPPSSTQRGGPLAGAHQSPRPIDPMSPPGVRLTVTPGDEVEGAPAAVRHREPSKIPSAALRELAKLEQKTDHALEVVKLRMSSQRQQSVATGINPKDDKTPTQEQLSKAVESSRRQLTLAFTESGVIATEERALAELAHFLRTTPQALEHMRPFARALATEMVMRLELEATAAGNPKPTGPALNIGKNDPLRPVASAATLLPPVPGVEAEARAVLANPTATPGQILPAKLKLALIADAEESADPTLGRITRADHIVKTDRHRKESADAGDVDVQTPYVLFEVNEGKGHGKSKQVDKYAPGALLNNFAAVPAMLSTEVLATTRTAAEAKGVWVFTDIASAVRFNRNVAALAQASHRSEKLAPNDRRQLLPLMTEARTGPMRQLLANDAKLMALPSEFGREKGPKTAEAIDAIRRMFPRLLDAGLGPELHRTLDAIKTSAERQALAIELLHSQTIGEAMDAMARARGEPRASDSPHAQDKGAVGAAMAIESLSGPARERCGATINKLSEASADEVARVGIDKLTHAGLPKAKAAEVVRLLLLDKVIDSPSEAGRRVFEEKLEQTRPPYSPEEKAALTDVYLQMNDRRAVLTFFAEVWSRSTTLAGKGPLVAGRGPMWKALVQMVPSVAHWTPKSLLGPSSPTRYVEQVLEAGLPSVDLFSAAIDDDHGMDSHFIQAVFVEAFVSKRQTQPRTAVDLWKLASRDDGNMFQFMFDTNKGILNKPQAVTLALQWMLPKAELLAGEQKRSAMRFRKGMAPLVDADKTLTAALSRQQPRELDAQMAKRDAVEIADPDNRYQARIMTLRRLAVDPALSVVTDGLMQSLVLSRPITKEHYEAAIRAVILDAASTTTPSPDPKRLESYVAAVTKKMVAELETIRSHGEAVRQARAARSGDPATPPKGD